MTMTFTTAAKLLDIKLPTTPNALKQAYKRASLKYHPDHNKSETAAVDFINVREAYDLLLASGQLEFTAEESHELKTEGGIPLATLGKGLGPTTNGTPCPSCDSRGFYSYTDEMEDCPDCRPGFGLFSVAQLRCRRCRGSGQYGNKGKCFACHGKGWVLPKNPYEYCPTCRGVRRITRRGSKRIYNVCGKCEGIGELPMWNPVLPKGLLIGRNS